MSELFKSFQEFRKILCVCPCCGEIHRLSDLKLRAKGPAVSTWLDKYELDSLRMDRKEELFDEKEHELREKAREKGRKAAQRAFNLAISPAFKALNYDPFDVKPILNPIDFVVFNGMNAKEDLTDVVLLSKSIKNKTLNSLRNQVKTSITKKSYEWQVARIDELGNIKFE